eukprot:g11166.t2
MAEAAPWSREQAQAEMASAEGSLVGDGDSAGSSAALPARGIRGMWSSIRGVFAAGSTRTLKSLAAGKRSTSAGTEDLSPPPSCGPGGSSSNRVCPHVELEACGEVIVPECGIKPGMAQTTFESKRHGFRLHVQEDSVTAHPAGAQNSGPITVAPLKGIIEFEGGKLEGVLEVHCLPAGRRFDAPLMLDFLVEPGDKDDPIMDQHGRVRYEVLTRGCDSDSWARDPEYSKPPEIVKDDQGRVYVRVQVRHFSFWSCWKKIDIGPQIYHTQDIPWPQRRMHQSLIKNKTPGVDIHVYAMQLSQWSAALESVKAGAGAEGINANFELGGDLHEEVNPAALIPQMVTIPPGYSHWFEIPRVGAGITSSRKAAVVIVTESSDERDGRKMRMEAMEHLRSGTMLTVTLRVDENGRVIGSPCAAESGGILSQVFRVIQNQANSIPSKPPPSTNTEARSRSETYSVVNEAGSAASSAPAAGGGAAASGTRSAGAPPTGSPAMADSDPEESTPGTAVVPAAAAAANREAGDAAARPMGKEYLPPDNLARGVSGASSCAPPAELPALPSPVE